MINRIKIYLSGLSATGKVKYVVLFPVLFPMFTLLKIIGDIGECSNELAEWLSIRFDYWFRR